MTLGEPGRIRRMLESLRKWPITDSLQQATNILRDSEDIVEVIGKRAHTSQSSIEEVSLDI